MSHVFVNVFSLLLYSFSRILENCGSREIGLIIEIIFASSLKKWYDLGDFHFFKNSSSLKI